MQVTNNVNRLALCPAGARAEPVQHTPGPWSYNPRSGLIAHDERDENGFDPIVIMHERGEASDQRQANARLIAAAPALLEALKELAFRAERHGMNTDEADAAIASAEGVA